MRDHVLDASALVDALLGRTRGEGVRQLLRAEPSAHVPDVALIEALNSLRRRERLGAPATAAAGALLSMPLIRWRVTDDALRRGWELRENVSAYDATYVVLAERLDATLVTTDDRLARAVREHTSVRVADLGSP